MLGMMMQEPLLISSILRHAATYHGQTEIVSRSPEGPIHRYHYRDLERRAKQLANALSRLGLQAGDRVGTLATNSYRHLELYYGVAGAGMICHTINPRLFLDQIRYIINHAEDTILFADPAFLPILEALADHLTGLKAIVLLTDEAHLPSSERLPDLIAYDSLIAVESDQFDWPVLDENTASGLCYTSGTTSDPKGVLYSHRSIVLHALSIALPDVFGLSASDTILPVVPMFHVNAWGLPFVAPMVGARLVMPGAQLDGASLRELFESEGVTFSAGVPTVWLALLDWLDTQGIKGFSTLKRVAIGGSAVPPAMISRFGDHQVDVRQAWGMTETSPVSTAACLLPKHAPLSADDKLTLEAKQGRPLFGVDLRIIGGDGQPVARDGQAFGDLQVRGPWVAAGYYRHSDSSAHGADGWFSTGDVATMDEDGFIQIIDRTKDVVKSGGEWISSITLENLALDHPAVQEAAVVARPDRRWGERPVLVVVLKPGMSLNHDEMVALYSRRIAKWSIPDELIIVDELPHTATGKLLKRAIRDLILNQPA